MKKVLLISCVMLALAATAALAGTLNLSWGPVCASDGLVVNKDFACNTNSGTNSMIISFAPTADHELILAVDMYADGQMETGIFPAWQQYKTTGQCRATALSLTVAYPGASVVCQDPWAGQASGAITFYGNPDATTPVTGNRARMKATVSVPAGSASPVTGATEYYAFQVNITNAKTVGTGACAGCTNPLAWVLNSLVVGYSDATVLNDEKIETPLTNQCVTWQHPASGLCGQTPTQNKTWGQVKSLYR